MYHFKTTVKRISSPGAPGEYETEAVPAQFKRENLTRERYAGFRMSVFYDVLIDAEKKTIWFWLPTPSTVKLLGIKKKDISEQLRKEPQFSVIDVSEILRRDNIVVEEYRERLCFKGEEPDEFWKLFERASNLPYTASGATPFRLRKQNLGYT